MTLDVKRRAGELISRLRAWPLVLQVMLAGLVLVAVLAAGLWALGWLDTTVSGIRDWWTNRAMAELRAENERLKLEDAKDEGEKLELRRQLAEVQTKMAEKDQEIGALAEKGKLEDANLDQSRRRYADARAGRGPRPIRDRSDLDTRLRGAFPEAP